MQLIWSVAADTHVWCLSVSCFTFKFYLSLTGYKRTRVFPTESEVFHLTQKILKWFALIGSSDAAVLEFLLDMIKHSSSALCNYLRHYLQCKPDFTELVFSRYAGHYLLEDQCHTNSVWYYLYLLAGLSLALGPKKKLLATVAIEHILIHWGSISPMNLFRIHSNNLRYPQYSVW